MGWAAIRTGRRIALACGLLELPSTTCLGVDRLHFDRDIRPILSENCYACHGPGKQEAGLRLDSATSASASLESGGRAVVPGDLATSGLVARIRSTDPESVMPPPHTKKTLGEEQKALLEKWIASGAAYEQHWSFRPLSRPVPPEVPGVSAAIDRFIESRLAAEGLPVNAEADRATLIRRVTFALTGLPPTRDEVEIFLADPSADAYERLVDRLMANPHHGEEMARHWLDVARYADTHGLHLDNERQMWAYRDWVIDAFNRNLSFDRFTIEQLAGDLLPDATRQQKVATGFCRCNVTTSEGGSINDELLFRYAVDRTATMTNAWMGLTGQCAVCHDHKFDPLSSREFYSLYAFFNSAADPGFDGNRVDTPPVMPLPSAEQERTLAALDARIPELSKALDAAIAAVSYADPSSAEPKPEPTRSETIWFDDDFPPKSQPQSSAGGTNWLRSENAAAGELRAGARCLQRTASGVGQDFYAGNADPLVIASSSGDATELFAHVWIDPANPPRAVMLQYHTDAWKHRAIWGDPAAIEFGEAGTTSRFHAGPLPKAGEWVRLSVPADKVGLTAGAKVTGFAFTQCDGRVRWDLAGTLSTVDPTSDPTLSFAAWWKSKTDQPKLDDVPEPLRNLAKQGPEKTTKPEEVEQVRRHWLTNVWSLRPDPLKQAIVMVDEARQKREALDKEIPRTFVFADQSTMRDSFVMLRGAYDKPGDKVTRATPAFLPPLTVPEGATPNRLDLANWLVTPEQPLTARVAATRLWQQFFGVGLVKTSEDFGLQGEPPSHPDLLDWLAAEYRESGWNTRHIVKLIVTSRAFRRASPATPELIAVDPENRLLTRGPRFRLDAEQIRDNALAVSGLLVKTMGGKGEKPYQPPNIWEPVGFTGSNTATYKQDSGTALYRRSLYTFLKRTAPPPFLVNFDAPNREQFCARRERSNTPLQALQLITAVQHVEAARALAARALVEGGANDAARIGWLFRTVLARDPAPAEAGIVADSLAGHRARYAADEAAAAKAIAHGASKPPAGVPANELAPWTLVATMILNLDETLTRN
ncbi:MAG: PSD1 and planctomycete cytochrome C domain-containing protein, partial [Planctomycetaceae bacterium]